MKILSICIPTYNRPGEIKHLNDYFLRKVLDLYGEVVEIVICDNSDDVFAEKNRNNIDSRINYIKNGKNIGFGGNVLRCTEIAIGEYIWLLPDNDEIFWDGFESLMHAVKKREADCFLVPYTMVDHFGEVVEQHYSFLAQNEKLTLLNVLSGNEDFLPFVLLSGGVVRLQKKHIGEIRQNLSANIFIQIALLLSMLRESSTVLVLPKPLIDYKVEYRGRFAPVDLFDSIIGLLDYLSGKYECVRISRARRAKRAFRSLIFLLLGHYSGLCSVHRAEGVRGAFFIRLLKHVDVRNILICLIILLPPFISGQLYIVFLAKGYANKINQNGVLHWLKIFREGVTKLRDRRLTIR